MVNSIVNNIQNYKAQLFGRTSFRSNVAVSTNLDYPPDSIEISTKKKDGKSNSKKWGIALLGTVIAVGGGILLHKHLTRPTFEKCQQNLSKILRREVSKEETQVMLDRYKELFKIEDKEEFTRKAFDQIKKDYGYENLDVGLEIKELGENTQGGFRLFGFDKHDNLTSENSFVFDLNKISDRKKIFDTIVHEFQHCKQYEMAYRADKTKLYEFLKSHKCGNNTDLFENYYKLCFEETYVPVWEKLPKIEQGTDEYKLAMKYLEEFANYKSAGTDGYWEQVIEIESHSAGDMAQKIVEYVLSKKS